MTNSTDALATLIHELTACSEGLIKLGKRAGTVSKQGNSFWGILKLLSDHGAMTVPQLAAARKLSRQRIQVIVDEYLEEGLLELHANPAHKRSKLIALTTQGKAIFQTQTRFIEDELANFSQAFETEELVSANRLLCKLNHLIQERIDTLTS